MVPADILHAFISHDRCNGSLSAGGGEVEVAISGAHGLTVLISVKRERRSIPPIEGCPVPAVGFTGTCFEEKAELLSTITVPIEKETAVQELALGSFRLVIAEVCSNLINYGQISPSCIRLNSGSICSLRLIRSGDIRSGLSACCQENAEHDDQYICYGLSQNTDLLNRKLPIK